jgi:hypothetical protein
MAPNAGPNITDQNSLPLADYFFIAGIESTQIYDEKLAQTLQHAPTVEDTIEEHTVLDTAASGRPKSNEGLGLSGLENRSSNSTARFSYEIRKSMGSLIGSASGTASNRSSATIKPVLLAETTNGVQLVDQGGPASDPTTGMSDEDFESALKKFTLERDEFMEEMHFSAGTLPQITKPKTRPRTQKIINDEANGLRGSVGSIRRRLSTMNSLKRQPSVMRQGEASRERYFSKRLGPANNSQLQSEPRSG